MNPDFPPGYDPFFWWVDRLHNMAFIQDETFNGDIRDDYTNQWYRGVYFPIL